MRRGGENLVSEKGGGPGQSQEAQTGKHDDDHVPVDDGNHDDYHDNDTHSVFVNTATVLHHQCHQSKVNDCSAMFCHCLTMFCFLDPLFFICMFSSSSHLQKIPKMVYNRCARCNFAIFKYWHY